MVYGPTGPGRALETFCGASNGRRYALIAPFDYTKKTRVTDVLTIDSAVETVTSPGLNHLLYLP